MIRIWWGKGHGFNDESQGANNIDKDSLLLPVLGSRYGFKVEVAHDKVNYGFWSLRRVRFQRHRVIARMVDAIEEALDRGDSVVLEGYSNGWNYWLQAIRLVCDRHLVLAPGQKIIMLGVHPAGVTKPAIPQCVDWVQIYFTRSDWAVRFATWASVLRLAPQWGRLGFVGYQGDDPRVSQPGRDLTDRAKGHGGAYHDWNYKWFAKEKMECVASRFA